MSGLAIKRPEKTIEFCTDLALQAEWEAAGRELADVAKRAAPDARMTGDSKAVRDLKKRIQELETTMLSSLVVFTLRALPRKRFVELEEAHPPREGDAADQHYGVNMATFIDAVMVEPGTLVSVADKTSGDTVDFTAKDWPALADDMSSGQWQEFALPLLRLNRGTVTPGFNRAAWQKTPTSAQKSK